MPAFDNLRITRGCFYLKICRISQSDPGSGPAEFTNRRTNAPDLSPGAPCNA